MSLEELALKITELSPEHLEELKKLLQEIRSKSNLCSIRNRSMLMAA